ncbi:hypothetical protein PIB30_099093 [Stylosanthes scabra]|uniref:Uncharacterized protein n=1 Tax=Stylosanthes scabra TaxID=79078 RepID=A0ABU6VWP5_9FABA|nr:hypothetical protein [Stylosanthes scabra]
MEDLSMFQRPRIIALEDENPGTYRTVLIYPLNRLVERGFVGDTAVNPWVGIFCRRQGFARESESLMRAYVIRGALTSYVGIKTASAECSTLYARSHVIRGSQDSKPKFGQKLHVIRGETHWQEGDLDYDSEPERTLLRRKREARRCARQAALEQQLNMAAEHQDDNLNLEKNQHRVTLGQYIIHLVIVMAAPSEGQSYRPTTSNSSLP